MAASAAGDTETATRALHLVTRQGLSAIPRMSTWLATMMAVSFSASVLGESLQLAEVYELLLPFRALPIRPSLAVVCYGSVEWPLGLAAEGLGRLDVAIDHYQEACAGNKALGNLPAAAIAYGSLGDALLRRDCGNDRARAATAFASAAQIADAHEMPKRAAAWRSAVPQPSSSAEPTLAIEIEGRLVALTLGAQRVTVPVSVGATYLQTLIASVGSDVPAEHLVTRTRPSRTLRQPVADRSAIAAYRERIRNLQLCIEDAEIDGDASRAEDARTELAALVAHLGGATDRHGHPRGFLEAHERARVAVQKALRRFIETVAAVNPTIGDHLHRSVHTGRFCRYTPAP